MDALKFLWNDFVAILLFSCSDFNCWAFLGLVPWGLSYYFLAHFLKPFKGWLKILAHRGETQTQRDKNTIAKNTHVRERTVLMWVFRFLLTMLLKLIEVSVSKVFGVLFNKLFARYLCGGFGFVKLLRMTSCISPSLLWRVKLCDKISKIHKWCTLTCNQLLFVLT